VLERAILPLDETALGSLQRQANVLHDLGLIPQRVNVRDGTTSLLMRQNWTY
jgi:sulfonate transport system substrate-binding protein